MYLRKKRNRPPEGDGFRMYVRTLKNYFLWAFYLNVLLNFSQINVILFPKKIFMKMS